MGLGKDPLAAALCLVELVGPSRFSHFDGNGLPVGKAHAAAFVQIAAVNLDQTQNTTTMFALLITDQLKSDFQMEVGKELIYARGGKSRLKAVTSSPRALEGGRSTFIILNETHHWIRGNNGIAMYETIDGNATKMDGRYLAITNAYQPGEDSVAERMRDAWSKVDLGTAVDVGLLYDSLEAPSHAPLDPLVLPTLIELVRGDAVWLKVEAILKSIQNTAISAARSRRMWLNQIVAGEEHIYGPENWDPLAVDAELKPGDPIVMGFDGGKSSDSTALVAVRTTDNVAFLLHVWERPEGPRLGRADAKWQVEADVDSWEVPRAEVDEMVRNAFQVYDVHGFYADVALWESYIAMWEYDLGTKLRVKSSAHAPIAWDMRQSRKRVVLANERLIQTIFDGLLKHDGDKVMRAHVLNVCRRENNPYGVDFGKESRNSPKKIDIYAALVLAFECLTDLRQRGAESSGTGLVWFLD